MNIDMKEAVETLMKLLYSTDVDLDELKLRKDSATSKSLSISPSELKEITNVRVNSKKSLPKLFKLDKYDALESLSDIELHYQLDRRLSLKREVDNLISYFKSNHEEILNDTESFIAIIYRLIKSNRKINKILEIPLQGRLFPDMNNDLAIGLHGAAAQGIEPLRRISIDNVINTDSLYGEWVGKKVIESSEVQQEWLERDEQEYDNYLWESISHISELRKEGEMWISVDLYQSDEVLIANFAKLLDKWRSELGVEMERPSIGSWNVTKRKILEYKIMPMIDLELWASVNSKKINHGVLAVALFPDGDGNMDSFKIAQTVKPFIGKVLNKNALEKIRWEISKETDS